MIEWIIKNKEWLFSGVAIFILSSLIGVIVWLVKRAARKRSDLSQTDPSSNDKHYKLRLSPKDIFEDIESIPPFQWSEAEKYYEGLKVEWLAQLKSVLRAGNGKCAIYLIPHDTVKIISCVVDIGLYPELKIAKRGAELWICGRIKYVDAVSGEIALSDVSIWFSQ